MIIKQRTDLAGKIRIIWQQPSGINFSFKFDELPSEEVIQALANEREAIEELQKEDTILDLGNKALIIDLVEIIKSRPTITPAQFNNLLATKPWYIEVEMRYILYKLGSNLADKKKIALSDMTEGRFFTKVRDFIANTPIRRLAKLFLNETTFNGITN